MRRAIASIAGLLALAIVAVGGWAYAPDSDPVAVRAAYLSPASRFLTLPGGQRVHVRDEGPREAPVLVLVHGSNASLHSWEPWVTRLAGRYRFVSLDLPGHGLTGPAIDRRYGLADYAGVVDGVAKALRLPRFVLVGHSMGGAVAARYALAHPDGLRGLVLVGAAGEPDAAGRRPPIGFRFSQSPLLGALIPYLGPRALFAASYRGSVAVPARADPAIIDRYWRLNLYPGNRQATVDRARTPRVPITAGALKDMNLPTPLMWGRQDRLVPVSGARWYAAALPDSRTVIYDGVGHIPMDEVPARSAGDLARFVNALPVSPARATAASP